MFNLAVARKALWKYASNVDYATAEPSDYAQFDFVLNQVIERFYTLGTWKSMWKRPLLKIYGNTLTLPRGFETCHGWSKCGGPSPIYSRFHEFAGIGQCSVFPYGSCWSRSMRVADENAQTFVIPSGTFKLRAVATEVFATGFTFSGGLDQNGDEIFGSSILAFANGSTTTTQQYTQLPLIQKAITSHAVSLYAVDTTTSVATLIAVYAPGETIPQYRQYIVSGVGDGDVVRALCKLGFVAAVADADLIVPSHMGALKLGLMSVGFEDKNDAERAGMFMGPNFPNINAGKMSGAIDLLDAEVGELTAAEQPTLNVDPNFGAGMIPNLM